MPRLDIELASRGLARSRSHAAELIAQRVVLVDGRVASKPAQRVDDAAVIELTELGASHWVSRAALKLVAGLELSGVNPAGRIALDLGTSTGGFAQVLLEADAACVFGIEVGHGQLAAELADNPRLRLAEGVNARELTPALLAQVMGDERRPNLVVADLSFISLRLVLPAVVECVAPLTDWVLLVKPQFELESGSVNGFRDGVVTDATLRERALAGVVDAAEALGLSTEGVYPSPVLGTHGNQEFIAHFRSP